VLTGCFSGFTAFPKPQTLLLDHTLLQGSIDRFIIIFWSPETAHIVAPQANITLFGFNDRAERGTFGWHPLLLRSIRPTRSKAFSWYGDTSSTNPNTSINPDTTRWEGRVTFSRRGSWCFVCSGAVTITHGCSLCEPTRWWHREALRRTDAEAERDGMTDKGRCVASIVRDGWTCLLTRRSTLCVLSRRNVCR
jgi:hypothetical protein